MIDFPALSLWLGGGVSVVGLIQWLKGLAPAAPTWLWAAAAAVLSIGYSIAPDWVRVSMGILAVSQIGYETIIQSIRKRLGGSSGGTAIASAGPSPSPAPAKPEATP